MASSRERARSDADDIHRSNFASLDAIVFCGASSLYSKKVLLGTIKATGVLSCTDFAARRAMASLPESVSGISSEGKPLAR